MKRAEILEAVKAAIDEVCDYNKELMETAPISEIVIDSLETFELHLAVEDKLNVNLSLEPGEAETVGEYVDLIYREIGD